MPMQPDDPALLMTSGDNPAHHIIRRLTNEEEVRSLGVHMNFHGTFAHHAKMMRFKFDGLARRLQQSAMSPGLSQLFYNSFYLPSVRYSLSVTSTTPRELHRAQSLMRASILNKLGYNRHYPHAVAFAPPPRYSDADSLISASSKVFARSRRSSTMSERNTKQAKSC